MDWISTARGMGKPGSSVCINSFVNRVRLLTANFKLNFLNRRLKCMISLSDELQKEFREKPSPY